MPHRALGLTRPSRYVLQSPLAPPSPLFHEPPSCIPLRRPLFAGGPRACLRHIVGVSQHPQPSSLLFQVRPPSPSAAPWTACLSSAACARPSWPSPSPWTLQPSDMPSSSFL